jgi:hypothetical protein
MGNACKSAGARPVQNAWDNHFSAFAAKDVDKILMDYTAQSVITIYDQSTGTKTVHTGLEGVRACFEGFFKSLTDTSDLDASVQIVKEARKHEPGNVFLVWKCPASGYTEATDTFIFDASSRILRQNVVFSFKEPAAAKVPEEAAATLEAKVEEPAAADAPKEEAAAPVEATVEEPAAADAPKEEAAAPVEAEVEEPAAAEALAEALIESGPVVHDGCNRFNLCNGSTVATNAEVIEPAAAKVPEEAAAPVEPKVVEPTAAEAPKEETAAPVEAKVDEPAAAEAPKEEAAAPVEAKVEEPAVPVEAKVEEPAAAGTGLVHDGWANHFKAFGDQDVEKILKDYVAESEITVVNQADAPVGLNTFKGLEGVRSCFEGLFKNLHDCSDLAAPIIHVEEAANGAAGQVFLVWSCPASGYQHATDTFIFNSAGKITHQHVVVHYVPAAAEAPKEEAAALVEAKVEEPAAADAPKEEAAAPVEAKVEEPAAAEAPKEEAAAPVVS